MIKTIVRDVVFLGGKSSEATNEDKQVAVDLIDTLKANFECCVGLAANMIGVKKRIIAFVDNEKITAMYNPIIVKSNNCYEAEEGCLSLDGTRKAKRYKSIKVKFQNEQFSERIKTYTGFTAQIIQHEIDHCNGVII